jgi:hypothetical protein
MDVEVNCHGSVWSTSLVFMWRNREKKREDITEDSLKRPAWNSLLAKEHINIRAENRIDLLEGTRWL